MMRRLLVLLFLSAFLAGCGGAAQKSEFWQHDTMYRTFDHMCFSCSGYKNPNQTTMQDSLDQKWWGIEIPYVPGQ